MRQLCYAKSMRFEPFFDFEWFRLLFWSLVFGLFGFVAPSELLHLGLCSPRALQQAGRGAVRNFPGQSVNTGKAKKYTDKITDKITDKMSNIKYKYHKISREISLVILHPTSVLHDLLETTSASVSCGNTAVIQFSCWNSAHKKWIEYGTKLAWSKLP